jgi:hypothetical protein
LTRENKAKALPERVLSFALKEGLRNEKGIIRRGGDCPNIYFGHLFCWMQRTMYY